MSLVNDIKKAAHDGKVKIQSSDEQKFEKILNQTFYKEKDIEKESQFVRQVMTRGLKSTERFGLHASALIVSDNVFCIRQQVLSLLYKQEQNEQLQPSLLRIFEQGNAIHEKWQRLFLRAGFSDVEQLDKSQFNKEFEVSFTPDIICKIPELFGKEQLIGEIKSVNTYQFQKMEHHQSGEKQAQFYMYLTGLKKAFTLCEDKNTQDFKVNLLEYDPEVVAPFIERLESVQYYKDRAINEGKMVKRHCKCTSADCEMAEKCPMRNACWNVGFGRVKLEKSKYDMTTFMPGDILVGKDPRTGMECRYKYLGTPKVPHKHFDMEMIDLRNNSKIIVGDTYCDHFEIHRE